MFEAPPVYGLPPKFDEWRPGQVEAISDALNSDKRFIGVSAPTGFGKSLFYEAIAKITGMRTVVLTSTKALQTQLMGDFGKHGLVDVRGMVNYACKVAVDFGLPEYTSVLDGPCHAGAKCNLKGGGCLYFDAIRNAGRAANVSTNYAFWMHSAQESEAGTAENKIGIPDLLVLDEAHDAPDELASFLSTEITYDDLMVIGEKFLMAGANQDQWKEWGWHLLNKAEDEFEDVQHLMKGFEGHAPRELLGRGHKLKRLIPKLRMVATMKGEWVNEEAGKWNPATGKVKTTGFKWDCLWPYAYSEKYLFQDTPKVLLVSATIRPKTAEILGIPSTGFDFREYPSTFAASRRPVIHVPTVQVNHRTDETQMRWWLNRIDQLIDARRDRKGIIHTVSYARAKFILDNSRHKDILVGHDSKTSRSTAEKFKFAPAPLVLVSPSMTTGWDFPHDQCRYQIIGKLPFMDNRAAVIKARMTSDKEYGNYITAQTLVQTCGRGMRAEDDWCETLIVDDSIRWFLNKNRHFFPEWWLDSYKSLMGAALPPPLNL